MIPKEIKKPFWICVSLLIAVMIGLVSIHIFNMGNDNFVEEITEKFVEYVSGIKIDLSRGDD